ncbi:hypothetical protein LHJ74_07770 [Streptomyces sp. N2-109]|uniref:Uncharacterized protein n=1 Tax=Streptomyces gossypii TaxID=2883101 RepID=A0ABT2JPL2_9ACTN|nr:hypothetical protein [Streptomyces gossypii]MCT2589812.1 hypothetical protein [Streptomyces gossypii]
MSVVTLLKVLVQQRGQTYKAFSAAYMQAAREVATLVADPSVATARVTELTFRRWTGGYVKTMPNYPAPQILEHMYGRSAQDLLADCDATHLPQSSCVPALNESDLAMTAREAAAHAGDAASHVLPEMTLDQLDDDVSTLARTYGSTSPLEVYRRAKELLTIAQTMADRTQVPRQKVRAFLAAGQSAALLSAVSFDLGAPAPAVQLARTSALYGQVTEHGPLQAYAHGVLAFLAYWDGRPSEAVRHVRTAQGFPGLGDTARVRLAVIEGRAHGHLGDQHQAQDAIRASGEQDTGVRDELHDDVGGEFGFPQERAAMSNATTFLLLREADGAERAAQQALDAVNTRPPGQRPKLICAQAAIDLGRARLLRRDLDGAQEALNVVFETPSQWRGAGILARLTAARRQLAAPGFQHSPAAASLSEQIEEFSEVTPARSLGGSGQLALGG